jgi:hypothetical protein
VIVGEQHGDGGIVAGEALHGALGAPEVARLERPEQTLARRQLQQRGVQVAQLVIELHLQRILGGFDAPLGLPEELPLHGALGDRE